MRYRLTILLISLLVVLPQSMLSAYAQYSLPSLILQGSNLEIFSVYSSILAVIGIFLNPVMLFVLMYIVGTDLRLDSVYVGVIEALLVGGLVGGAVGHVVIYIYSPVSPKVIGDFAGIIAYSAESVIPVIFAGFTGAALAFLRKSRLNASPP